MLAWLFNESKVRDQVVVTTARARQPAQARRVLDDGVHPGWPTRLTRGREPRMASPTDTPRPSALSTTARVGTGDDSRRHREPQRQPAARHRPGCRRTIPVIMEHAAGREFGAWLAVTVKPSTGLGRSRLPKQWSTARSEDRLQQGIRLVVRRLELTGAPAPASVDRGFFTRKGNDVYAILTRWPGGRFTWRTRGLTPKANSRCSGRSRPADHEVGNAISIELPLGGAASSLSGC